MKKTILIYGSTGFIMSNFIRYILYRSKNFKIICVDNLENLKDAKRIYYNKDCKFYIGDFTKKDFIDKIIYLEKPKIIIYGDEIYNYEVLLKITMNLINFNNLIFISPFSNDNDFYKITIPIKNMLLNGENTYIEVPNKFGMRQKINNIGGNLAFIMYQFLFQNYVNISDKVIPWVYSEDIASLIWFIIEKQKFGYISMPPLGFFSEGYILNKIEKFFNKKHKINFIENKNLIKEYSYQIIEDWNPNYLNIDIVLEKTIKWFNINRWAF